MIKRPILSLRVRHAALERELSAERARPAADAVRIVRLKKLKLAIKDRMARFARPPAAEARPTA